MKRKLFLLKIFIAIFLTTQNLTAQNSSIDPALASQYFKEFETLCGKDKGKLWKVSLCAPILLVDKKTRIVTANQADKENLLTKNGTVFTGQLPAEINIANTATEWAGVKWVMMIVPLPEDKFQRATLMLHESWHRVQNELGFLTASEGKNGHLDTKDGRILIRLEWLALESALENRGQKRTDAISDALVFRAYRRSLFPNAATDERGLEMNEGLAEYSGVKLSSNPDSIRYVIDRDLKRISKAESFVRSFAYASGPAYGTLLDESKADWRKNLTKEDDLGLLLQKKLAVKLPPNLKETVESRAEIYDGENLRAFETNREIERKKIVADYRTKLVNGSVLIIPLQKMNMQMNPGNLVPLDSLGTVYPDIRIVDEWGILTATKGALIAPNFEKVFVSAPIDLSSSPIKGDGWTLELKRGWTLTKGESEGNYTLKKTE